MGVAALLGDTASTWGKFKMLDCFTPAVQLESPKPIWWGSECSGSVVKPTTLTQGRFSPFARESLITTSVSLVLLSLLPQKKNKHSRGFEVGTAKFVNSRNESQSPSARTSSGDEVHAIKSTSVNTGQSGPTMRTAYNMTDLSCSRLKTIFHSVLLPPDRSSQLVLPQKFVNTLWNFSKDEDFSLNEKVARSFTKGQEGQVTKGEGFK